MQAVMQGISQIGVVTGHLRSNGTKKAFDAHRHDQVLSLLDSAASSLKGLPEMSEADKIVSNIVEAAHELVGHMLPAAAAPADASPQVGAMLAAQSLPDDPPSIPPAPAVNVDEALQSQAARHAAALKACPAAAAFLQRHFPFL
jgi:hypothetical protein